MSGGRVEQLAAAVADGESVDWESAQALLNSADERAVAAQLQVLSSLSASDVLHDAAVAARLPLILSLAKVLAVGKCLLAVVGYLVSSALDARSIPPVVVILGFSVFAGTAVWLDVTGRGDRRAQALAGVYWTSAASFAPVSATAWSQLAFLPAVIGVMRWVQPEAFFPLFLWHFARDFPSVTRFGTIDRLSRVGVLCASAVSVTLFAANVAARVPSVLAASPALAVLDRLHDFGRWFWLIVFATAIAALVWIVVRGELAERSERTRVRLFLWSIVAGVAPVAILVAVESTWAGFGTFMRTETGRIIGALLVYPPMFAFPLATAHVVLAHDVLDVTSAAQRALRYLLTRWLIAWGTSVPIAILVIVAYVNRAEPLAVVLSTPHARVLLWMAAFGGVLLAARGPLLRALDRWMLTGVADPATTLAELGTDLRTARTLMELSTFVARATERTMQTEVGVYFIEEADTLVSAAGDDGAPVRGSLVPVLLQGVGGPIFVSPRGRNSTFGLLSNEDRRWIQRLDIMALCPVMPSGAGRVRAVVALKARRNALSLSRTDEQFLAAVCAAAALAHARLEQMIEAAAPLQPQELAILCSACGRIEAWQLSAVACRCGGKWERAALPDIVAGRFRLDRLLGAGGMGVVYKAQDLILRRDVAVKTLPHLSAEAADRLLDEARAMAAMSHAHIAVLYGAEQWRGTPVLMVEYLEGGSLSDRLRGGPLTIDAALEIGCALTEALVYMHATNRFHGDIKPSNIGFKNGIVKFMDFGLSRTMHHDAHAAHTTGGTLAYLSPEVLNGQPPGAASDVWALSVTLFQMLTGVHPFMSGSDTVVRIRAGLVDDGRCATLPASLSELLTDLLNATADRRPVSAANLFERMASVQNGIAGRSYV